MEQESDSEDDNQNEEYKEDYIGKNMVSHSVKDTNLITPPM